MSSHALIKIQEHQEKHTKNLCEILKKHRRAIDCSPTGTGKTFVSLFLAKKFDLPVFIICPVDVKATWAKNANLYGINVAAITSYESLYSKNNTYLERIDVSQGKKIITTFKAVENFIRMVNEGILIIFDEAHKLKNDSMRTLASIEIAKKAFESEKSKFLLLSATLFDKEEHSVQILKMLQIYNADQKQFAENVFSVTQKINSTKKFYTQKEAFFYSVFKDEIKNVLSSSMETPKYQIIETYTNSFYRSSKKYQKQISDTVEGLSGMLNVGLTDAEIKQKREKNRNEPVNDKSIISYLISLEKLKIEIFARVGENILKSNENAKLIICVYFLDHMDILAEILEKFNPLIYNGSKNEKERLKIRDLFNSPNNVYRLIIMNSDVSLGTDFHDTDGRFPRFMLLNPSYKVISMQQSIGRISRYGVKSNVSAQIIYSLSGAKELGIMTAIWQKSKILGSIHEEQVDSGKLFPGDFPIYREREFEDDSDDSNNSESEYEERSDSDSDYFGDD